MITRKQPLTPNLPARYQVKVQGRLDSDWIQRFQGIAAESDGEVTTLNNIVADQSALRGLLCYIWDFNLIILSVILVYPGGEENEHRIYTPPV